MENPPNIKILDVTITPEDCRGANYCDIQDCGLARVMKRQGIISENDWIAVGADKVYLDNESFIIVPRFLPRDFEACVAGETKHVHLVGVEL